MALCHGTGERTDAMPRNTCIKACLHGVGAALTLWFMVSFAAAAVAQEAAPQPWDKATASSLLTYIQQIDSHGLNPDNYQPVKLRQAIDSGDSAALERQADESFGQIAADLAIGRVKPGQRGRYYIAPSTLDPTLVARMIDIAVTARRVDWVLDSFAPQDPQYAALRKALGGPDGADPAKRRQIQANLERWRWFPHNPGARYLMVNIPEYRLRLLESGKEIANHNVIVGQVGKQTPQFETKVTGVILNPTWTVPQSIIAESVGSLVRKSPATARSRGYSWTTNGGRLSVVQKPGPGNSLGQLKLDMPNPLTIFIHDTPSKALFDREDRTFSHGCIRTQYPFDLAEKLLANVGWNRTRIDSVVASRVTTRVPLSAPLPAYVVYLTAVPQPDGGIAYLKDPYKLDATLAAKLN
jgi:murein L,D-transpeptidase YcbB/YkuD